VDVKTRQTRIKPERLRHESFLPQRTFLKAKAEVLDYGLIEWDKATGLWTLVYPVPEVPSVAVKHARIGAKKCHGLHSEVQPAAHADGRNSSAERVSAIDHKQTKAQLEEQIKGPSLEAVQAFLVGEGLVGKALSLVLVAVNDLRSREGVETEGVDGEARRISRQLQALGMLDWYENRVRGVLLQAISRRR
jgi:hypothetical protein